MILNDLSQAAAQHSLGVFGICHTEPDDGLGEGTMILLGPEEPGFWRSVVMAPEFTDQAPDPLDRWSARVISEIATAVGGSPLFPFGNPQRPFIGWALRTGRAWPSPVGLLVHDTAGLLVSFRGAVYIGKRLVLPETSTKPCDQCVEKPCLSACPVGALSGQGYDLARCHSFLDTGDGEGCMSRGCAVRSACPVSKSYRRDAAQSSFHMAAFHPRQTE